MSSTRRTFRDWTRSSAFPAAMAMIIFVLAGGATLFPAEIREATRAFLERLADFDAGRPSIGVIAFWGLLAVAAALVRARLSDERGERADEIRAMLQAVHRTPGPVVFLDYRDLFRAAEAHVRAFDAAEPDDPDEVLETAGGTVRAVLAKVIDLAEYFSRAPRGSLRAGVTLVAAPDPEAPDRYPEALVERLRFFDHARHRLDALRALLYLPADLRAGPFRDDARASEPVISLPVPPEPETRNGGRLALPGAPYALLTGEQSVYEDTHRLAAEWCGDLERFVREEVERYFSDDGDGRHTRSFASLRLGDETDPIGVLTLESDRTHVLGPEPEYYVTFFALVTPLLHLLIRPAAAYAAAVDELGLLASRPDDAEASTDAVPDDLEPGTVAADAGSGSE